MENPLFVDVFPIRQGRVFWFSDIFPGFFWKTLLKFKGDICQQTGWKSPKQLESPWLELIHLLRDDNSKNGGKKPSDDFPKTPTSYMSSVENPGWLFDIGDYTTQLYGDCNTPL